VIKMKIMKIVVVNFTLLGMLTCGSDVLATGNSASNGKGYTCKDILRQLAMPLDQALQQAVADEPSGLAFNMWATIVARDGTVCAVARSGALGDQWPGSRAISAQKANTANAFSLDGLALSTANLYSAVQPGGSLYGLQHSNPVDTGVAYKGPYNNWGTPHDPMIGERMGGVNVFGGGLGLYNAAGVIGGLGLSGDTSCADHMKAWRVRHYLGLDHLSTVGGPASLFATDPTHPDNIIYDISGGVSASGFGQPTCLNTGDQLSLPAVQ
jgi:uncharacterized protein GlcG (DUF336 family)